LFYQRYTCFQAKYKHVFVRDIAERSNESIFGLQRLLDWRQKDSVISDTHNEHEKLGGLSGEFLIYRGDMF